MSSPKIRPRKPRRARRPQLKRILRRKGSTLVKYSGVTVAVCGLVTNWPA